MCVVSAMGDHYSDKFKPWILPQIQPYTGEPNQQPRVDPFKKYIKLKPDVTREEFDELKRQVEEMKKILKVAAEYDARNNEPHCEIEDKVKLLKEIAKLVNVDLSDVFPQTILQPYMQVTTTEIIPSVLTTAGGTSGEVTTFNVDLRNIKGPSTLTSNSGSL